MYGMLALFANSGVMPVNPNDEGSAGLAGRDSLVVESFSTQRGNSLMLSGLNRMGPIGRECLFCFSWSHLAKARYRCSQERQLVRTGMSFRRKGSTHKLSLLPNVVIDPGNSLFVFHRLNGIERVNTRFTPKLGSGTILG